MNNESRRLALNDVINHINNAKRCQNDIDDLYDLLCSNIYQERYVSQPEKGIEKQNLTGTLN